MTPDQLLDLLERIQWGGNVEEEGNVQCPDCGALSWRGHWCYCDIAKALADAGRKVEWETR